MLISNVYVNSDVQSFETPRKKYIFTAPGAQNLLGYDDAQSFEQSQCYCTYCLNVFG